MTAQPSGAKHVTNQLGTPYQVVAACDFSPLGDRAVLEALRACAQHAAAALHVLTVAAEGPSGVILPGADTHFIPQAEARERMQTHVGKLVDEFLARGGALPMDHVGVYVASGLPSERILALATAVDADLIVLGTHGRHGIGRMLLGSVAEAVVRRAPCGVFVIRPRDFLQGEKVPEIQPPLKAGEHPLLPFHTAPAYHYIHRMSRESGRIMPSI
jgi:nucleotide-binding universal stress UspA family protein